MHPTANYPAANRDQDEPFYFAASDLIAGGERVGSVLYTDH